MVPVGVNTHRAVSGWREVAAGIAGVGEMTMDAMLSRMNEIATTQELRSPMARIYMSSTFEDLKAHRAAVGGILRKMAHTVIGMEDYAAADERPVDRCQNDARSADIYIGIVAWRRGFVPTGGDGASITELEYRAAGDANKPRLVFLVRDDAEWPASFVDAIQDPSSGERVRVFREQLKKAHIVAVFLTPSELAAACAAAVTMELATSTRVSRRELAVQLGNAARYELGPSGAGSILSILMQVGDAAVLELDFGTSPWWSTRVHLVALTAWDYTSIEAIAFTENERYVATVPIRAIRRRMGEVSPEVERAYIAQRANWLLGAPADPTAFSNIMMGMGQQLQAWPGGERALAQDVSAQWVHDTFRTSLSDDQVAAPKDAARALDLYDILSKRGRFVALVSGNVLERVIDRYELGSQIAASLVRDLLVA
jgi:hypothetical protein